MQLAARQQQAATSPASTGHGRAGGRPMLVCYPQVWQAAHIRWTASRHRDSTHQPSAAKRSGVAAGDLRGNDVEDWSSIVSGSTGEDDIQELIAQRLHTAHRNGVQHDAGSDDLDLDFSLHADHGSEHETQMQERRSSSAQATTSSALSASSSSPGCTRRAGHAAAGGRSARATQPRAARNASMQPQQASPAASQQARGSSNRAGQHHDSQTQRQGTAGPAMDDRLLTKTLARAASLQQLKELCAQHAPRFNHLHVACAFNRLAKVAGHRNNPQARQLTQQLESLFVHHLPQLSVREVANGLWSWNKLGRTPEPHLLSAVLDAICDQDGAMLRGRNATPQALSSLTWGLSTLECIEERVWVTVMSALRQSLQQERASAPGGSRQASGHSRGGQEQEGGWSPFDIAQAAYACASAGRYDTLLFHALSEAAMSKLAGFNPQDLSNLLWAMATARHTNRQLFEAAVPVATALAPGCLPQSVANMLWAFTVAQVTPTDLFQALSKQAARCIGQLIPAHVAQLCWSMARSRQVHAPLLQSLARAAAAQPKAYKPKELAMVVWALATCRMPDAPVFVALRTELLRRMSVGATAHAAAAASRAATSREEAVRSPAGPRFYPQDLANMVWAHSMAGLHDSAFYDAAAELCLANQRMWLSAPQAFQSTVWSFGYAGHYHQPLFSLASDHLAKAVRAGSMSYAQVAGTLLPMAQMQHHSPATCSAVAAFTKHGLEEDASAVGHATLANVLWSLAVLDHCDPALLSAAFGWVGAEWVRSGQAVHYTAGSGAGSSPEYGGSAYKPGPLQPKQLAQYFQVLTWLQAKAASASSSASSSSG
eukprot:CAMPEP_0202874524 /NCGR_PEP_ID=MMETSP1391-20130828/25563_1 /ASSEMBLY_ACC=CAM_ASM_000867 /TAXON_ID=1034604 /ORGANISM="Chlamydomonas leiostraca, Strain SAG 11-49" /LENGTH=826 /DNA_ID=CAMNT_0049555977 /DNA_START=157 /DNA_END=2634 /DNA_ORIENTATION=-